MVKLNPYCKKIAWHQYHWPRPEAQCLQRHGTSTSAPGAHNHTYCKAKLCISCEVRYNEYVTAVWKPVPEVQPVIAMDLPVWAANDAATVSKILSSRPDAMVDHG